MAVPVFPHTLMREAVTDRPRLAGAARSGGRSVSGIYNMSRTDGGGLWAYGLQSIAINTREQVMAFEQFATLMAEGARPIIVPVCNRRYKPTGSTEGYPVRVTSDAPLRATTLIMTKSVFMETFIGGELFSIDHPTRGPRLYRIIEQHPLDSVTVSTTIEPPLRQAVAANQPLVFDEPLCVMQLAEPTSLQLELRKHGRPSLNFIESFLPLA